MTIKHLIGLMIFSALGVMLFAQPGGQDFRRGRAKMNPEAQKEIKAYMEKEVLPVLRPERAKLESYLGETEKNTLASIRTDLKKMREEGKEFRKSMMEARRNGEQPSEEQITQMRAMQKNMRLSMDQAWEIADEYEIEIYEIFDGLKDDGKKWHEDIKTIREKYKPEGTEGKEQSQPQRGKNGNRSKGNGKMGRGRMGGGDPVNRLLKSPVQFLLWDGSSEIAQTNETGTRAFPNPTRGEQTQTLTYKVKKAGSVSIQLVDPTGNVVRTIEKSQLEKGQHEVKINTRGLDPGVYIYRISTKDGTTTKKIQIN